MSNLFSDLQKVKEEQAQILENATPPAPKAQKIQSVRDAQKVTHNIEQVSKPLSKGLSNNMSKQLTTDAIEELAFRLRKTPQAKINATIPIAWKDKFDDLAFRLKVGKYELLTYIVGVYLGEVERSET
jgi:hypothetical protein